jgi:hypothetical protein
MNLVRKSEETGSDNFTSVFARYKWMVQLASEVCAESSPN